MKKHLLILALTSSFFGFAQSEVLFTVEGENVTADEFSYVYNKNKDVGRDIDPKTPREYLELYINFKLKVHEAIALGMDTMPSFEREFNSYREQLARPYMTLKEVNDQVLREAYSNMAWDIRASHIMLDLPQSALPEDTLRVYNQLLKVREQILDGKRTFENAARKMSTDTYSARQDGDLGWFTAFNMVYPFEKAAYQLEIGDVSMPVRTQFGYHLIKTTDRRASRGKIEVAHILATVSENATEAEREEAKRRIDEIYEQLQNGADFAAMARQHSDDKTTANIGGGLPQFGMKEMLPEFEEASFGLEHDGDISAPFKTKIGWHIVKRIHHYDLGTFDEMKNELTQKIERDTRSNLGQELFLNKLRKEYDFEFDEDNYMEVLESFQEAMAAGQSWISSFDDSDDAVYSFADVVITQAELGDLYEENQSRFEMSKDIKADAFGLASNYAKRKLLQYENEQLTEKYPEFKYLVNEYREGILLFDLTKDLVWDKASIDTTGLQNFYEENIGAYQVGERYSYVRITAASREVIDGVIADLNRGDVDGAQIVENYNSESPLTVRVDSLKVEVGANEKVDEAADGDLFTYQEDGRWVVIKVVEKLEAGARPLNEIKGLVTSDYQKYLEAAWVKELREKYTVEVNEDVMSELEGEL